MKTFSILLTILAISISSIHGQNKKTLYLGIQPGITVEPFYDEGEFDINVFPLIIEMPINTRLNFRLCPMVNYHLGGVENGISDLSVFTVFPIFFNQKEQKEDKNYGFYLGLVIGFGRNLINDHYTTTIAIEPGYMFEAKKSFTINIGVQFGASHFSYDSKPNKWLSHWGPKVTFGFWLN